MAKLQTVIVATERNTISYYETVKVAVDLQIDNQ